MAEGKEAARLTGLAIIATIAKELGSLDRVVRVVKTLGMLHCTDTFEQHPEVHLSTSLSLSLCLSCPYRSLSHSATLRFLVLFLLATLTFLLFLCNYFHVTVSRATLQARLYLNAAVFSVLPYEPGHERLQRGHGICFWARWGWSPQRRGHGLPALPHLGGN